MGKKKYTQPFQALTIRFNGLSNRIITDLGISEAFDPKGKQLPFYTLKALWDTGATKSVIKPSTVKKIGLVPSGKTKVKHAGGTSFSNTYLVNFMLPNKVGITGVIVCECDDGVGDFGAIIGMDIINLGDFSISNFGKKTYMTFRTPSYRTIDYVKESIRIQFDGVKAYAPCPCGKKDKSEKPVKFSECHGKPLQE